MYIQYISLSNHVADIYYPKQRNSAMMSIGSNHVV